MGRGGRTGREGQGRQEGRVNKGMLSKNVAGSGNPRWLEGGRMAGKRKRVLLGAHCSKLPVGP